MSIKRLRKLSASAKQWNCGPKDAHNISVAEVEAALAEYDALRAALEQVEWGGEAEWCACCQSHQWDGHASGCAVQSALRQSEGGGE